MSSKSSTSRLARILTNRIDAFPPWVVVVQLFIGIGWLRAAVEKLIEPDWWSGKVLRDFSADQIDLSLPWYRFFLDLVIEPNAVLFAFVVLTLQVVSAIALLSGRQLGVGLASGIFLNLHFVAAGAVSPSVFYLTCQGVVALWLVEGSTQRFTASGLVIAGAFGGLLSLVSIPFIGTVHPMDVIDDAAAIFAYGGSLTVLACVLAARQIFRRPDTREEPDEVALIEALLGPESG